MAHAPMDLQESSRDVCAWMKTNSKLYPRIAFMAQEFLSITSTSVPSECAFSSAGEVVRKKRARLGDDAIQAICELQSQIAFIKQR